MKKRLSTLTAIAAGVTFLFAPVSPAHAAGAEHCWTNVETGQSRCFATFAEVVSDLSGGRVTVSGGASAFSTRTADAIAAVSSTVTIGVVYENINYGGASNVYVVSEACDTLSDVDYQVNLASTVWNDRISSFESFENCDTKLWSDTYSGTGYGWYTSSLNVGAINDLTSSIQWR